MDWLDILQWPAMAITVVAAWLTGSQRKLRRMLGFWCFLLSNVLWGVWGWHQQAWAMVVLQLSLAAMNIRGVNKNVPAVSADPIFKHEAGLKSIFGR